MIPICAVQQRPNVAKVGLNMLVWFSLCGFQPCFQKIAISCVNSPKCFNESVQIGLLWGKQRSVGMRKFFSQLQRELVRPIIVFNYSPEIKACFRDKVLQVIFEITFSYERFWQYAWRKRGRVWNSSWGWSTARQSKKEAVGVVLVFGIDAAVGTCVEAWKLLELPQLSGIVVTDVEVTIVWCFVGCSLIKV